MTAKHTPGPWVVRGPSKPTFDAPEGGDFAIHANGQIIAEAFRRTDHTTIQPAESNARLIAAAPELLSVAKSALLIFQRLDDELPAKHSLRTLLDLADRIEDTADVIHRAEGK